ncbi:hypothetical protein EI94DRAFT_1709254 [Lactarius quietus]|nr:hypothetical protein EI94DRAFT_1709254 [Lactarius quietus]
MRWKGWLSRLDQAQQVPLWNIWRRSPSGIPSEFHLATTRPDLSAGMSCDESVSLKKGLIVGSKGLTRPREGCFFPRKTMRGLEWSQSTVATSKLSLCDNGVEGLASWVDHDRIDDVRATLEILSSVEGRLMWEVLSTNVALDGLEIGDVLPWPCACGHPPADIWAATLKRPYRKQARRGGGEEIVM